MEKRKNSENFQIDGKEIKYSKEEVSQNEVQSLNRCSRFRLSNEYELSICNCKHIMKMKIKENHSAVNPQKWLCNICHTTDSVWACLSCPNVACGRYIHEHALNHYLESKHPLVVDVNELYVYCYDCEEYVLNDNKSGDIKVLRETLQAIRYQNFTGTTRGGHTLRTATMTDNEDIQMRRRMQQQQLDRDDRLFTAIWHSRFVRQRKAFRNWLHFVKNCHSEPPVKIAKTTPEKRKSNSPKAKPAVIEELNKSSHCHVNNQLLAEQHDLVNNESALLMPKLMLPNENSINITDASDPHLSPAASSSLYLEEENLLNFDEELEKTYPKKHEQNNSEPDQLIHKAENNCSIDKDKEETQHVVPLPILQNKIKKSIVTANQTIIKVRPKRANAAGRYKEIMDSLLLSKDTHTKRLKLSNEPVKTLATKPKIDKRRSLRIQKKIKIEEKLKAKKVKKNTPKSNSRKSKTKPRPTKSRTVLKHKALPPRSRVTRRITTKCSRRSVYDSVPNRTVTSLIPGVTGLRNLGNTCYLNSIIQVLGHLQKFRRCLLAVRDIEITDIALEKDKSVKNPSSLPLKLSLNRRSTLEMFENQESISSRKMFRMQAGLNGGHEDTKNNGDNDLSKKLNLDSYDSVSANLNPLLLCHELHDLYHIMWSGKWKLVSPYHLLNSVWKLIPSFRGYSQQDAQEFLCELLDKIMYELERPNILKNSINKLAVKISGVVQSVFSGRLHSCVKCLDCNEPSSTFEPFWDLSLEFPERYHTSPTNNNWKTNTKEGCGLLEMLEQFTLAEKLDGGKVYNCSHCNNQHHNQSTGARKRRLSFHRSSLKLSEAEKQIKIVQLPQILRFHLKRFRWSGRNHREKIGVPVTFPSELDMSSYCSFDEDQQENYNLMYDLSAVVIHHGRGFSSGHYTAYCWNDVGKFWVHCNDSNLELCSIDDVMASQAYILFYSQRGLDPLPHLFSPPLTPNLSPTIQKNEFIINEML